MSSNFILDERLDKDGIFIHDFKLCRLNLYNNKLYPWLILIPRRNNIAEIIDLETQDRIQLFEEICLISEILKRKFNPDKLNVAALGNMVPQLHIHIIARFKKDECFPKPTFGERKEPYSEEEIDIVKKDILLLLLEY